MDGTSRSSIGCDLYAVWKPSRSPATASSHLNDRRITWSIEPAGRTSVFGALLSGLGVIGHGLDWDETLEALL
jgi:hypothetical protein